MSWITLTPDELNDYLPASLLRALRTKALSAGQADPLPDLLQEIIHQVRATLAAAGYPLEAAPGTFPQVLKTAVAFLTIALAHTRLPGLALTTEQRQQIADAKSLLNKVARGEAAIEGPTTPDTTLQPRSASVRVLDSRATRLKSQDLERLG